MKRAICRAALAGALTLVAACAGAPGLFAGGNGMFLKLGPATLGLGDTQQGWLALNSLNWAGGYPQQGYAVGGYPQQGYGYSQQTYSAQTYPTYDATGQAYGATQTYPQQTYDPYATGQTYPQQTYDTTGQTYGADQAYGTTQTYGATRTYPQQAYGATGDASGAVPSGAGLASLSTSDPAAAAALAQACATGQQVGTVTVRQVQPDGTYQDIQLNDVNLACGSPAAGGEAGADLKPGEEVMMTFGDAKVVNKGKLRLR